MKICRQPLNVLYKPLCAWLLCPIRRCQHREKVPEDRVYHHIEDLGGDRIPLSHYALSLEGRPEISTHPCYHWQAVTVPLEELQVPGAHYVHCEDV